MLTELLRLARDERVDLIGDPRLVRLNPNVPWKTRGNAALGARFARGRGSRRKVGEADGRPLWSYPAGRPLDRTSRRAFVDSAWNRVRSVARPESGTDPALVAVERPLPAAFYRDAVRSVVPVERARELLARSGAEVRTLGSERGLVGAAAAVAWPGRRRTFELIAYRGPERTDAPRRVDPASVRAAAAHHPELFLCYDRRTRRLLVAPHTRCPILYGLRAVAREPLLRARTEVRSEAVERWVVFRTNQATGDHLAPRPLGAVDPYDAAVVEGRVADAPEVLAGGHVRFSIRDDGEATATCLAFEPTKTLPAVARSLVAGDRVRLWGGRGSDPTFRLEGIRVLRLVGRFGPPKAPRCPRCDRRARSLGAGRGYRCPTCHRRFPPERAVREPLPPRYPPGAYHPTPSARRHLHPLAPEV